MITAAFHKLGDVLNRTGESVFDPAIIMIDDPMYKLANMRMARFVEKRKKSQSTTLIVINVIPHQMSMIAGFGSS